MVSELPCPAGPGEFFCFYLAVLTFLDLVAEQVDLLPSSHAASRPVHPHYLQVGGVWSL